MQNNMWNVNAAWARLFEFLFQFEKSIFDFLLNTCGQNSFLTNEFGVKRVVMIRGKCCPHSFVHAEVLNRLIGYLHPRITPFTRIFNDWTKLGWFLHVRAIWVLVNGLQVWPWDVSWTGGWRGHFQYRLTRSLSNLSWQLSSAAVFSDFSHAFGLIVRLPATCLV